MCSAQESRSVRANLLSWISYPDDRNSAAKTGDRIGDPNDIVGSVCVQDGEVCRAAKEADHSN